MSDGPPPYEPPAGGPPADEPAPVTDGERPGFRMVPEAGAAAAPPPPGPGRHRLVAIVAAVAVAVLAAVGVFVATRSDPPPPPTPTTEAPSTTQLTLSSDVVVARALQPSIQVAAAPPASWDAEPSVIRYGSPPPPSSAAELAAAGQAPVPLPNPDYPIQGRVVTPAGWLFGNPTSLDNPFVMMVTERRGDHLQVQIPVRPNGTVGYVRAGDVELTTIQQRIELDLSDRLLRFYDGDALVAETQVVVGVDDTRTPTGRFYVTDRVPKSNPDGAYGPLVLATSAYSEQLDVFDDGTPVIAFHGTNQPELVGSAASNGCIRLPNEVITLIGDRLQIGARVDIRP